MKQYHWVLISSVLITIALLIFTYWNSANTPSDAVKVLENGVYDGYMVISPLNDTETFLINNNGKEMHRWDSEYYPGNAEYLLENGDLLRGGKLNELNIDIGGAAGVIERISWEGNQEWKFLYAGEDYVSHHDIEPLPNGNILVMAWERVTAEEALAAGVNEEYLVNDDEEVDYHDLFVDYIIEVNPETDEIVWEWHAWDHIVQNVDDSKPNFGTISNNPGLVDVNYYKYAPKGDPHHANSIDYNEKFDQILLSVRHYSELWIIDHNTTTEEAAGKEGNLLYRWGNPEAYGQGTEDDRVLFMQHDAEYIPPGSPGVGNVLVFSNGQNEVREYSTVIEVELPQFEDGTFDTLDGNLAFGEIKWEYGQKENERRYSWFISGSQRLKNGNTLISYGADGIFLEVTPDNEIVWEYENPLIDYSTFFDKDVRQVFRSDKYPADYPAFDGRWLLPLNDLAE